MVHYLTTRGYLLVLTTILASVGLSFGASQTLCNGQRYDLNAEACQANQLRSIGKCADLNTTAPAVWRYALILDNYLLVNSGLTPDQLVVKYGQYFHDVELYYRINFNIDMQRVYTYVETTPSFSANINTTLLDDFGSALRRFAFGANMPRDAAQYLLLTGRGFPSDNVIGLTYESSACNSIFSGGDNFNYVYDIDASDNSAKVIEIAIHEISHSLGGDHPDSYSTDLYSCAITRSYDPNADDRMMRRNVLAQSPSNPSPLGYYFLSEDEYISDCATMTMKAHMDEFKCMWSAPAQNSVILYSQPNFAGDSYTANLRYSVTDCVDLSSTFNDQAQSFGFSTSNALQFHAIRFWSEQQCTGDSYIVGETQLADLGAFGPSISSFDVIYFPEESACPVTASAVASSGATSTGSSTTGVVSPSSSSSTIGSSSSGPCSISVRQTLTNSWQSGSDSYSQYDVTYINTAASGASAVISQLAGGVITQFWSIEKQADGLYHLPSYLSSGLAAGSSFTWGYIILSNRPAAITIAFPTCHVGSESGSTSASGSASTTGRVGATTSPVASASTTSASAIGTTTGAGQPGSCTATVSQTVASTWTGGGQITVVITNSGSKAITALQFSLSHSSSATLQQLWNAEQQRTGAYAPEAWALPLAVGATINSIGYTYDGTAPLSVSLASVSC